ncbi:hypothetical protein [Armatimonas rosea]|nr:hypothetical protein [Armatimonas rosea]
MTAAPVKDTPREARRQTRLLGWQGFTLSVPEGWELSGFSGSFDEGYLRVDDGREQGLELKWATEPKKTKKPLDVEVRAESYLASLSRAAKKKKLEFESELTPLPRGVQRTERTGFGFKWTGDKKAFGALWHCKETRRVVIAQVIGDRSGRKGLAGVAESILASIENRDAEPGWRLWSLFDLTLELPSRYQLASQQLMNVYLRLSLADGMDKIGIEQWAVANVARRDAYLDSWVEANAKGDLTQARSQVEEASVQGHEAIALDGGLAFGQPWVQAFRDLMSLHVPATRFSARAWHCEPSNKIYLVQSLRPRRATDPVEEIVARMRCHV